MSRTWKSFGLAVLSLSLFVVTVPRTFGDEKQNSDKLKSPDQRLADLEQDLKNLRQGLKADFKQISDDIAALKPIADINLRLADLDEKLQRTNRRIDLLQDAVRDLDKNVRSSPPRVARYFEPPLSSQGTIRLDNRSVYPATVVLDNVRYEVAPLSMRQLERSPSGDHTYEVYVSNFGLVKGATITTLAPNQILTIFIGP
jgi:hypothetical protein